MTRRTAYLAIAIPAQVLQVVTALVATSLGLGDRDAIIAVCFIVSCVVTVLAVLAVDAFGRLT